MIADIPEGGGRHGDRLVLAKLRILFSFSSLPGCELCGDRELRQCKVCNQ